MSSLTTSELSTRPSAPEAISFAKNAATIKERARASLADDVHELTVAARTLSTNPSFRVLQKLCIKSRRLDDRLHNAVLSEDPNDVEEIRQYVRQFVSCLQTSREAIEAAVERTQCSSDERKLAIRYSRSIQMRERWGRALAEGGVAAMYMELLDSADNEDQTLRAPILVKRLVAPANEFDYAAANIAFALDWLCQKLALIWAEAHIEHGPFAASTREHAGIAEVARECVLTMLNGLFADVARFASQPLMSSEIMRPHLASLQRHLDVFEASILEPLRAIANGLVESDLDELPVVSQDLDGDAEKCVQAGLAGQARALLAEVRFSLYRVETRRNGAEDLGVLLHHDDDLDSWFAFCLERGLLAQGSTREESLEYLSQVVRLDYGFYARNPHVSRRRPFPHDAFCQFEEAPLSALRPSLVVDAPVPFQFFVREGTARAKCRVQKMITATF